MAGRLLRGLLAVCAASAIAMSITGCGAPAATSAPSAETGADAPTLRQFFDADAKTGEFVLRSFNSEGKKTFESTGTLWVDGRKFRYTLSENGKPLRDITSPDGTTAYFVEHRTKVCEPSVAGVDRYLLEFTEPATASVEAGVDEETGATRVVFSIKKLDDLAGAANAWYTEDVTYLVKNGSVIGVETRGDKPDSDGSYDLSRSRRMFTRLVVGERIPPSTFELPYPVKGK